MARWITLSHIYAPRPISPPEVLMRHITTEEGMEITQVVQLHELFREVLAAHPEVGTYVDLRPLQTVWNRYKCACVRAVNKARAAGVKLEEETWNPYNR